jgi:putative cofactor-binding repeat protein
VTGNIIENAPTAGISVGWGQYLRDVSVTGNVVRGAGVGIAVSVSPGAGSAVIADNLIAGTKSGAIVGMDQRKRDDRRPRARRRERATRSSRSTATGCASTSPDAPIKSAHEPRRNRNTRSRLWRHRGAGRRLRSNASN